MSVNEKNLQRRKPSGLSLFGPCRHREYEDAVRRHSDPRERYEQRLDLDYERYSGHSPRYSEWPF